MRKFKASAFARFAQFNDAASGGSDELERAYKAIAPELAKLDASSPEFKGEFEATLALRRILDQAQQSLLVLDGDRGY